MPLVLAGNRAAEQGGKILEVLASHFPLQSK